MIVTKKWYLEETERLVELHAPRILEELGMDPYYDGLLKRIEVSPEAEKETPLGVFLHQWYVDRFQWSKPQYIIGSGEVILYPLVLFRRMPWFLRLSIFKGLYRKSIINTLAHELRHYWQMASGEFIAKEVHRRGIPILPYEDRWCEKDANAFGRTYLKKLETAMN